LPPLPIHTLPKYEETPREDSEPKQTLNPVINHLPESPSSSSDSEERSRRKHAAYQQKNQPVSFNDFQEKKKLTKEIRKNPMKELEMAEEKEKAKENEGKSFQEIYRPPPSSVPPPPSSSLPPIH